MAALFGLQRLKKSCDSARNTSTFVFVAQWDSGTVNGWIHTTDAAYRTSRTWTEFQQIMKDQKLINWDKAMDAWDECSCVPKRLCPHALEVRKASDVLDKNRDAAPSPLKLVWSTNFT
jgi:hypothetical protein